MSDTNRTQAALAASISDRPGAREEFSELLYERLRALTADRMRGERADHTLQPTALAHEVFLKLVGQDRIDWQGRTHFMAVAATQVQRVLIDHARARATRKRGGAARRREIDEADLVRDQHPASILDLSAALARLAEFEPRQARVVELRFFGGLTMEEAADAIGISKKTAKLDWRAARTWLGRELGGSAD